jgi:hypothetical protein
MSHRPTKVSPHVEARILLTTVAGRSSMDRMAEGAEHMVIETPSVYRVCRRLRS